MKNVIKKDEDGYYVKFSRYPWKEYKDRGGRIKRVNYEAPQVLSRDGSPYRDLLGAGSDVTVKVEIYSHNVPGSSKKAKAARLTAVMIDNLVPYTRKDFTPEQENVVRGLEETPRQPAW
jgi:hypothetical protein